MPSRVQLGRCLLLLSLAFACARCFAAVAPADRCPRPAPGSSVAEPADLRSVGGVLKVQLSVRNSPQPDGSVRYCYVDAEGHESPNLRLHPGDLLVLTLRNQLVGVAASASMSMPSMGHGMAHDATGTQDDPCHGHAMSATAANLHFHGLTVPPVCHQDDVLHTLVAPGSSFEYRFRIPQDEPPGLYWYHPHVHGFSRQQVLGGASGALIVEGIERADRAVAGLPERVLIVRDQDLLNPNAPPSKSEPQVPKFLIDHDGDAANNGTGFGKPAKDLSINFVPVPYPDYPPAVLELKPGVKELWRVLNASAVTYLNLEVLVQKKRQPLGLVAIDGVPWNDHQSDHESGPESAATEPVDWQTHLGVPPGSRVEFIVTGPPAGESALLVTRTVDTGPGGENDPNRALVRIVASPDAASTRSALDADPKPLAAATRPWVGSVTPDRVRRLYFSEKAVDPGDPKSAIEYYLTVDGQKPQMFDPSSGVPDIVVQQGTVEDWIIENRSNELHDFHIHQLHFLVLSYMGQPVREPFLRDTINVPYYDGRALQYPSVRVRLDFRDPDSVGEFPYHCHLLEHEDGGMMGTVRVEPSEAAHSTAKPACSGQNCRTQGGGK